MADACTLSGYTRDQMRALLRDLPTFMQNNGSGRTRIFTRVELLSITIVTFMEQRYGIKRVAIGAIIESLIKALQSPREIDSLACLIIITGEPSVRFSRLNEPVEEGLVIPLAPIFNQLDTYLGAKTTQKQIEITFEPAILRNFS